MRHSPINDPDGRDIGEKSIFRDIARSLKSEEIDALTHFALEPAQEYSHEKLYLPTSHNSAFTLYEQNNHSPVV
ncbi:jg25566 [Pararge aegeria aegeria]|uniref:Jg25566 protein n=1 Tax=Pararge aegeria aegeria TaxID=348720 RepID=A0A8S4RWE1_9NEOP|nr:jg25566 [Pararge aegeria aegeria]